ncbi:MAG: L-histidine N(alpha)-methyltransferase [Acidobacteria bacterium]|nr:L-histidine N(alpha)-methyltransferase [Acidobacteriota bacterium]
MPSTDGIEFHDHHPRVDDFREEVLRGLSSDPKQISPKFFYDKRGSELFDRITQLEEYYPTRAELSILEDRAEEIADLLGHDCLLIEYGSGSSRKVGLLLDALEGDITYVAIDISREHLLEACRRLSETYPQLEVIAVCADYSKPFPLPAPKRGTPKNTVVFFPGSTIGNFSPEQAASFLRNTARQLGPGGSLLIGVDLKKNEDTLYAAYNDAERVTAAFNLNLLERINQELDADFDPSTFRHRAFYNNERGRVEMRVVQCKMILKGGSVSNTR